MLQKLKFKFLYHNNFSFHILDENGHCVPTANWETLFNIFMSQLSILYELIDDGFAELKHDTCEVDTYEILNLSEINKQILGLPDEYPYDLYIESNGQLNQNSFKFKYDFYDFAPNGTRLLAKRNGPIVKFNDFDYLLSLNQFHICQKLDDFNSQIDNEKSFKSNLSRFADIKELITNTTSSNLDNYLNNQNVTVIDKIKIDINFNNNILEILPRVGVENEDSFLRVFDIFPKIQDVYQISDNSSNQTTRIVISDQQKVELTKIKKNRKIDNLEIIDNLVDKPELMFDEDFIDYSIFYSERVKEIGIYKPKFFPFICPYKSEWIPGFVVKDKIIGEKRIYFKSLFLLSKFIEAKEIAELKGQQSLIWEEIEIPLLNCNQIIENAKLQFETIKRPIKEKKNEKENEVLIIYENADITEFSNDLNLINKLNNNFQPVNNLNNKIILKEHQLDGIAWLQNLYTNKNSGCLLADDMGLGKTLQLLYFIEWHSQNHNIDKPYLIVAPVSLLENWESEYNKFFTTKNLQITKLYNKVNLTKDFNEAKNKFEAQQLQKKQIILTNYETLRVYQATLCLIDYAIVTLDEAQKIKTPGTLITNVCKALKSDFKIAMTGTPIENTLVDIWCIIDFAMPGLLGNAKDFTKEFQNPLKQENINIAQLTERLRNKIGYFLKRRLKKDVAKDLPKKYDNQESRKKAIMPNVQLDKYKCEIEKANDIDVDNIESRNKKLRSIWAVRDISDHPYLVDNKILDYNSEELIATSAKLKTTIEIIKEIQIKNDKVIIFAERKETQKMLQKVVYDIFKKIPNIINGDTPSTTQKSKRPNLSRQQTIDKFQAEHGFNIIIMSPLAAGIGLNVTEANHIIHYTRHWNPAKEEQATDRAYRIGQTKEVFVYYPMAIFPDVMLNQNGEKLKSFDEVLDNLLNQKKALAHNTLFPTENAEINQDELFGDIFNSDTFKVEHKKYSIEMLDKLLPLFFEASIGAIYSRLGFEVQLTPASNDKGVDVVLLSEDKNYLVQVKQSSNKISISALQEVIASNKHYKKVFNHKDDFKFIAVTNNEFTKEAVNFAKTNDVEIIDRTKLIELLNQTQITYIDIDKIASKRMKQI